MAHRSQICRESKATSHTVLATRHNSRRASTTLATDRQPRSCCQRIETPSHACVHIQARSKSRRSHSPTPQWRATNSSSVSSHAQATSDFAMKSHINPGSLQLQSSWMTPGVQTMPARRWGRSQEETSHSAKSVAPGQKASMKSPSTHSKLLIQRHVRDRTSSATL